VPEPIADQNVVRVHRVAAGRWIARIGPDDDRGFETIGSSGQSALERLVFRLSAIGWTFDESAGDFHAPKNPVTFRSLDKNTRPGPGS
jgi:hypothetical protein